MAIPIVAARQLLNDTCDLSYMTFNLKAAVERGKAVQAIDLHRECTNCVVTFWVMNQFLHLLGKAWGVQTFVIQRLFLGSNGGAEKQTREKHVNDLEE